MLDNGEDDIEHFDQKNFGNKEKDNFGNEDNFRYPEQNSSKHPENLEDSRLTQDESRPVYTKDSSYKKIQKISKKMTS